MDLRAKASEMNEYCDTCWGSHGCELPEGHDGPHRCGPADNPCSYCDDNAPTKDATIQLITIDDHREVTATMDVYNSHPDDAERAFWAQYDKD